MIKMGSFRSYVGLEEYEMKVPHPQNRTLLQPCFLSGELVVAEAQNVLKFTSLSKKKGFSGSLFVTNARLVFVSSDHVSTEDSVPLMSINTLCHYERSTAKKTKRRIQLGPNTTGSPTGLASASLFSSGSTRIHELLVICSNFRTLRVSFKFSRVDQGHKICNALIHWAFPQQPEKLFYLDYCRSLDWKGMKFDPLPLYNVPSDWLRELKITRSTGFRLTDANESFRICQSLPESFVVPEILTEVRLVSLSGKLKGHRPPFWVWGDFRNSAILRMGKLHNEADSGAENAFYETLRRAHPQHKPPRIYDLDLTFQIKEIRLSMTRLIELCCPETFAQYEETDSRFYSLLESTKWFSWLAKVLHLCNEIANSIITNSDIVILQENESRDISCLISSVTQILLEARFRTTTGFFSLIQKEWVATGHSFHSTYMHASPVFLLFLDSVFQLINQNPFEFEFNEQLLNDVWDSCFDSTTGTFLFDTPAQRKEWELRKDLTVWHRILTKDDSPNSSDDVASMQPGAPMSISRALLNPMYKLRALLYPPSAEGYKAHNMPPPLVCSSSMCDIQLWNSLYLSRTVETAIMLGTGTNSNNRLHSPAPAVKNLTGSTPNTPSSKGSIDSTTSSTSCYSPNQGSVFLFSTNNNETANGMSQLGGRDPTIELKLVELLLATLSSTTRFYRNSQMAPRPNPSSAITGNRRTQAGNSNSEQGASGSTSPFRRNQFPDAIQE